MDSSDAAERLRRRHGQGIACAALAVGSLNLEALIAMSKPDATRAIELSARVMRGDAWRRERVQISDEEYALVVMAMSPASAAVAPPQMAQPDPPVLHPAGLQVGPQDANVEPAQAPQAPQAAPELEPPGTVSRSRSRPPA